MSNESIYKKNINELCQQKFSASAYKIICQEMGKNPSQLTSIYNGILPVENGLKQDFEKQFAMPWHEIASYIKYGERKNDLPKGYSAEFLRKKFEVERSPDLNTLLPFLGISEDEWNAAINGENEWCYFMSDELEEYFDLFPNTLRGELDDSEIQTTHCFTPYPHESEENCTHKRIDIDTDIRMSDSREFDKIFEYRTDAAIIKTRKDGKKQYIEEKESDSKFTTTLKYVADALFSDKPIKNKDTLADDIVKCVIRFWNTL